MKLIIAIINHEDTENVENHLREAHIYLTKIASVGGFLEKGNTTLLIGTDRVNEVVDIISKYSQKRTIKKTIIPFNEFASLTPQYIEVEVGGATLFILDLQEFRKI